MRVLRKSATDPEVVTLTRALIQTQSVRLRMLEQNYAYLRITQFHDQTPEKMAAALEGAFRDHVDGIGGIILDLRDNPGGLVRAAVGVSAAFLPQDALVVYTQGMSDASNMRMHAKKESYIRDEREDYLKNLPPEIKTVPLVVLVNGASASAAEIVAGALQDHKRAVVLGTQSYGKGTVQTIIPLRDNAALKLTTAYYYTPNGRQIQGKGVTPDYLVEQSGTAQGGARPRVASLQPEAGPLEAGGDNVSEGQLTRAVHAENKSEHTSPTPAAEPEGVDRQLEQALQLLRSLRSPKREAQPGA